MCNGDKEVCQKIESPLYYHSFITWSMYIKSFITTNDSWFYNYSTLIEKKNKSVKKSWLAHDLIFHFITIFIDTITIIWSLPPPLRIMFALIDILLNLKEKAEENEHSSGRTCHSSKTGFDVINICTWPINSNEVIIKLDQEKSSKFFLKISFSELYHLGWNYFNKF